MFRQAFRSLIVWFFANRDLQPARNAISRILLPFWPTYRPALLGWNVLFEKSDPDAGVITGTGGQWLWRRTQSVVDINPGSGEAFSQGHRPLREEQTPGAGNAIGPVDLFCHLMPRRIPREPALVLYCGADLGMAGFVSELLPRFFALDEMGVPKDLLLLVSLDMGQQLFFQSALIDQVFALRPVELMRKHRLMQLNTLHEISVPQPSPQLLARMAERIAQIYGPFPADGRPVFLCAGGTERAKALSQRYRNLVPEVFAHDPILVDPSRMSLRKVLTALASAPCVAAPNSGEAAALALVPSKTRITHELDSHTPAGAQIGAILDIIGEQRHFVHCP